MLTSKRLLVVADFVREDKKFEVFCSFFMDWEGCGWETNKKGERERERSNGGARARWCQSSNAAPPSLARACREGMISGTGLLTSIFFPSSPMPSFRDSIVLLLSFSDLEAGE